MPSTSTISIKPVIIDGSAGVEANKWLVRGKLDSKGKFLKSENYNEGDVWL